MLRWFMATQGLVTQEEAKSYHQKLLNVGYEASASDFDALFAAINEEIRFLSLELRKVTCEFDGTMYIGIVNNLADDGSKLCTALSPTEIAFLKLIIEYIAQHDGKISRRHAEALAADVPGPASRAALKPEAVQNAVAAFIRQKWLVQDIKESWLVLSPRTQMELRKFLEAGSGEGKWTVECQLCKQPCFLGTRCSDASGRSAAECAAKVHWHCFDQWKRRPGGSDACPACHTAWSVAAGD